MPQTAGDPSKAKTSDEAKQLDLKKLAAMYDFTGQTIVITGGTGILGADIACALAGCGVAANRAMRTASPASPASDRIALFIFILS